MKETRFPAEGMALYFSRVFCYAVGKKEVNLMKKQEILDLLYDLASPAALILAGLVLAFCPDAATALVSRLLGWCLTAAGIGFGIGALVNRRKAVGRGITAVGLVCIGGFLSANPLALAAFVGKILGVLILLRGLRELFLSQGRGYGLALAVTVTAAGAALTVLPMTASRLLFSCCGLVILAAGVLMLVGKLRSHRLPGGRDDIIDV